MTHINQYKKLLILLMITIGISGAPLLLSYTLSVTNGTDQTISFRARLASCPDINIPALERFETKNVDMGQLGFFPCCINISSSFSVNNKPIIHDQSMKAFSPCSNLSVIIRKHKKQYIIAKHDEYSYIDKKYSSVTIMKAAEEVRKNTWNFSINIEEFYQRVALYLNNQESFYSLTEKEKNNLRTSTRYQQIKKDITLKSNDIQYLRSHATTDNDIERKTLMAQKINALVDYRTLLYMRNKDEYDNAIQKFQFEEKKKNAQDLLGWYIDSQTCSTYTNNTRECFICLYVLDQEAGKNAIYKFAQEHCWSYFQ